MIYTIAPEAKDMSELLLSLEEKDDFSINDVKKVIEKWGQVEIVDAAFKSLHSFTILSSH